MLRVQFVALLKNGSMKCVTQTLTCLGVRPNHDVRSFVAGFRKLCPRCCYVDVVTSADITVSVMELGYKDHRVILFSEPRRRHTTKAASFCSEFLREITIGFRSQPWLELFPAFSAF